MVKIHYKKYWNILHLELIWKTKNCYNILCVWFDVLWLVFPMFIRMFIHT